MEEILREMLENLQFDGLILFSYKKDDGKVGLTSAFVDTRASNFMLSELTRIFNKDNKDAS